MSAQCGDCTHWHKLEGELAPGGKLVGECRRMPPLCQLIQTGSKKIIHVGTQVEMTKVTYWPNVESDHAPCGEFDPVAIDPPSDPAPLTG